MERLGPFLIAFAALLDVVSGFTWIVTDPDAGLAFVLGGGPMIATLFVYGGSWLTFLHCEPTKRLMALGVITLAIHLAVTSVISTLALTSLVSGLMLFLAAGSALVVLPGAWTAVERASKA